MACTACTSHRIRMHDVYNTRSCLIEDPDPSFLLCDKNIHRYVVTLVWKTWSTQRPSSLTLTKNLVGLIKQHPQRPLANHLPVRKDVPDHRAE